VAPHLVALPRWNGRSVIAGPVLALLIVTACSSSAPQAPSAPTPSAPVAAAVDQQPVSGPVSDGAAVQTFQGKLCPVNRAEFLPANYPHCSTRDPVRAQYSFPLHPGETATVNTQFRAKGDYYSESFHFAVRCGTTVLWSRDLVRDDGWMQSGPVAVTVPAPCLVEVEASHYISAFKSGTNTPTDYRIDVSQHR
jgi:hypothetical protein